MFLRLKDREANLIFGPFKVTQYPRGIVIKDKNGMWYKVDVKKSEPDRLPQEAYKPFWALFFGEIEKECFGMVDERMCPGLPDTGLIKQEIAYRLLKIIGKRFKEACGYVERHGLKIREGVKFEPVEVPVVMTIPANLRDGFLRTGAKVKFTYDVICMLFERARQFIKILCPYVDATFVELVKKTEARIYVITTAFAKRGLTPNPILERAKMESDVYVKYLVERQKGSQIYQVHAKMVICDGGMAYVGSANLVETSLHHNFEMGILIDDKNVIGYLDKIFDYIYTNYAVSSHAL